MGAGPSHAVSSPTQARIIGNTHLCCANLQQAGCPPFCTPDEWNRIVAASQPMGQPNCCQIVCMPPYTAQMVAQQLSVEFPHLIVTASHSWIFGLDYWELQLLISPRQMTGQQMMGQPMMMGQPVQAVAVVAPQPFIVTCPHGVSPGAAVMVVHPTTGQQLQVQVPPGISAGMQFQVQA